MGHDTLKKIRQLLGAGTLARKYHDIAQFLNAGGSLLYSGEVEWQVKLPQETMQGSAESIDAALDHIRLLFEDVMRRAAPDTKIILAMKALPGPRD